MTKKSLFDARKFVPEYFGNNREFQVFLKAVNIAFTVIKSNTDMFIPNLLNPLKCKARLLPLLSNYVGYDYNPRERVLTNRWITKLYPLLVRNRGNEIGITLAIAMSISLLGDPLELDSERSFSIDMDEDIDKYGRKIQKIKIYLYDHSYLSILNELLETVRPAGIAIEIVPAQSISSSETISLTDEYSIMKYDYNTGKLLSINDIDVWVKNSWDVMIDVHAIKHYKWKDLEDCVWGVSLENIEKEKIISYKTWGELEDSGVDPFTAIPGLAPYNIEHSAGENSNLWGYIGVKLVDGRFYDKYGNDLNRYVDQETGKILYNDGVWNNEYIKETRIYKHIEDNNTEVYTGMYFDVSQPAKVMNTYFKLLDDGIFSGFYLSNDDFIIYDSNKNKTSFKLIKETMSINGTSTIVWKVYDTATNKKYNWHVDMLTRKFVKDTDGSSITLTWAKRPFSETTNIGKKAFLMKITKNDDNTINMEATKYFVNKYGDIVDPAGNIILSKKDRYKISDSSMIGFSEIHDASKQLSTYDGTAILEREWSYMKDTHMVDKHGREMTNDFEEYDRVTDPRYKFEYSIFDIGNPVREYTGSELIRFVSNEELSKIRQDNGFLNVPLFVTKFDSENASGVLKIKMNLPEVYSLGDVFKNMNIRYEKKLPNTELDPYYDIYIDWTPNNKNKSLFNLNDLENPIHFIQKGKINKRTLHWTGNTIYLDPKTYDGTTKVYTHGGDRHE